MACPGRSARTVWPDGELGRRGQRPRPADTLRRSFPTAIPSATLILGHMGAFLPLQRSRLDSRVRTIQPGTPLKQPPSAYIGTNIVFTTSGVFSPATLTGAVLEVGADAVMFSVDYPYESSQEAVARLQRTTLSAGDRAKIAHANAERILAISAR
ncbi:amidohydrolase family protein [Mycobacterium avium]|nr:MULTISPECIES: amidohydrolase family protein [Mycobacteriaceae]